MRVEDILRDKGTNVATTSPDANISSALAMLRDRGIGVDNVGSLSLLDVL